jgi:hypothetical protein
MKKTAAATVAVIAIFVIAMSSSFANASLNINLNIAKPTISPNETQHITATANERGIGIVFVIQPAPGPAWTDFLNDHPDLKILWNSMPADIKANIQAAVGDKIVSYAIVHFGEDGGSTTLDFTSDFTGINGAPSTILVGKYNVCFAYLSYQPWYYLELGFTIGVWNVVPEVPLGTAAAACSMIAAVGFVKYKKRGTPKI